MRPLEGLAAQVRIYRCLGVANGLWMELSLWFGAQKRARYRGWLEGFGSMFEGSPLGSGLSSRSGLAHKRVLAKGAEWTGSQRSPVFAALD